MWSFFGSKFLEGDIGSLWYEFKVGGANKKTLDVCLFLCLGWVEVVLAEDVEWVYYFEGGQKIPKFGFSYSQFDKWLHKATFLHEVFYF
jgi:hypothetical protein